MSKGLLTRLRNTMDSSDNLTKPMLEVLLNQQSTIVTIRKNVKGLHESVKEMTEELRLLREDSKNQYLQMPTLMEKVRKHTV